MPTTARFTCRLFHKFLGLFPGLLAGFLSIHALAASGPIEILLPGAAYSVAADRALSTQVELFNRQNPKTPVRIIRRGEDFSSLRELMARKLAGELPDLAAIDPAELEAVRKLQILKQVPPALAKFLGGGGQWSLPFLRAVPLLLANVQRLPTKQMPRDWPALVTLVNELAHRSETSSEPSEAGYQIALPLQGARGLWVFEALANRPLWKREPGGLKSNRDLADPVRKIQRLLDTPGIARADESWEHAIQAFIDRKVPLALVSSDILPFLAGRATFEWKAELMPVAVEPGKQSHLLAGTDLVLTRDRPEVRKFLEFLYTETASAQWARLGGWLPLRAEWARSSAWKDQMPAFYQALLPFVATRTGSAGSGTASRSEDSEVVRARSEWIQALRYIFGDKERRPNLEDVLSQIDGRLAVHP